MKNKKCACRYDGPIQIVSCAEHNAAEKNLNRAQVMITRLEIKLEKIRQAWRDCKYFVGSFNDGPASPTPDREGIVVRESKEARESLLHLSETILGKD